MSVCTFENALNMGMIIKCFLIFQGICFVKCQDAVRLAGMNSTASQGRVEVLHEGEWGTICDDKFTDKATNVICNMLGYSNGGKTVNSSIFGEGTGKIWLDEVTCDGNEPKIEVCPSAGWGVTDCSHSEDVGVICYVITTTVRPSTPTTKSPAAVQPSKCSVASTDVRLIGPADRPGTGFVEVNYSGNWHSICDDSWDFKDAQVICRMLCYDTSSATTGFDQSLDYVKENVSSSILLDDVACVGTETNIFSCPHRGLGVHNCKEGEYASVQCTPSSTTGTDAPIAKLQCEDEMFTVIFSRQQNTNLKPEQLSMFKKQTGQCRLVKGMDTSYVTMQIPFTDCGTTITSNTTHLIYTNTIFYNHTTTDQNIVRQNAYKIEIRCEFPRNLDDDEPYAPKSQFVTIAAPGKFHMNMQLYDDNSFQILLNVSDLVLGQLVVVVVGMNTNDPYLKLIVPTCIATPTEDRNYPKSHTLFENNCIRDPTLSLKHINNTAMSFSFKAFKFLKYDTVYIHCLSVVCKVEEKSDMCDRSCITTGRRRRRSKGNGPAAMLYIDSPRMQFRWSSPSEEAKRLLNTTQDSTIIYSTMPITTIKGMIPSLNKSTTESSATKYGTMTPPTKVLANTTQPSKTPIAIQPPVSGSTTTTKSPTTTQLLTTLNPAATKQMFKQTSTVESRTRTVTSATTAPSTATLSSTSVATASSEQILPTSTMQSRTLTVTTSATTAPSTATPSSTSVATASSKQILPTSTMARTTFPAMMKSVTTTQFPTTFNLTSATLSSKGLRTLMPSASSSLLTKYPVSKMPSTKILSKTVTQMTTTERTSTAPVTQMTTERLGKDYNSVTSMSISFQEANEMITNTHAPTTSETVSSTSKSNTWKSIILRASNSTNDLISFNNVTANPVATTAKPTEVATLMTETNIQDKDISSTNTAVQPSVNVNKQKDFGEVNHAGLLDVHFTGGTCCLHDSSLTTLVVFTLLSLLT